MKVSILIPTLNRLAYLREALDSARGQTYRDLEILVSDDGSKDGSQAYVGEVSAADPRVRLLPPNPRPGLFTNINYLVESVGGDAFCILADDDRLLPEFVERLVAPLLADPGAVAAFSDHWMIEASGARQVEGTDRHSAFFGRHELAAGAVADPISAALAGSMCMGFSLYRTASFEGELFDLECGGAADFDYAIRAARLGMLHYVPERLGEYRAHSGTATNTRAAYMINGAIRVFEKYRFPEPAHERERRAWLRRSYQALAYVSSMESRREYFGSLWRYLRLGGNPLHWRVLLSMALVVPPHSLSRWMVRELRTLRQAGRRTSVKLARSQSF